MRDEENDTPGAEPLEEVGPHGCDASPSEAQEKVPSLADSSASGPQDCEIQLRDEMAEQFPVEMLIAVPSPVDGLPIPAGEIHGLALAGKFGIDSVVCLEDDREYVEVLKGEFFDGMAVLPRNMRERFASREAYSDDGTAPTERRRFLPGQVGRRWGVKCVAVEGELVLVRPRRERCVHYKRQVFANEEVPNPKDFGHRILYRNCLARRSVGGALMSLRDESVYACEYRSPPDPATVEKFLDVPDRRRLTVLVEDVPLFNLT